MIGAKGGSEEELSVLELRGIGGGLSMFGAKRDGRRSCPCLCLELRGIGGGVVRVYDWS